MQPLRLCHCRETRRFRAQNNSWFVVRDLNGTERFRGKPTFKRVCRPAREKRGLVLELTVNIRALASHSFFDLTRARLVLIRLNPIMLFDFFFYHAWIQGGYLVRASHSHAHSLHSQGDIGQNVARLNTKCKEIFLVRANPRPSIWFCLVKARRDGTLQ